MKKVQYCIVLKGWSLAIISFLLLVSCSPLQAAPQDAAAFSLTYEFSSPEIHTKSLNDITVDTVIIPGLMSSANAGEPLLPMHGAYILIPYGRAVDTLTVRSSPGQYIGIFDNLEQGSVYQTTTSIPPDVKQQDMGTSQQTDSLYSVIGTYHLRGFQILVLALRPISYDKQTGEVLFYQKLTITITTKPDPGIRPYFRNVPKDYRLIEQKIDNPTQLSSYQTAPSPQLVTAPYDVLLITTDEFKDEFKRLQNYHETQGFQTEIRILGTDIPVSYNVQKTCQYIRNYIREQYNESGIQFVLIGGDDNIIPAQGLHLDGSPAHWLDVGCDIYYACLDGPWDYNGDGIYGDPNDGENGGDVDLLAEVIIGRACIGNNQELTQFIDKTIRYQETSALYLSKALMVGEYLGYNTYGGDYVDQLIDGSEADGWSTVGISSEEYVIDTLYDRDWEGGDWPKSALVDHINQGVHLINHAGHSNWDMNLKLFIDELSLLENEDLCFIYSQGCDAGAFDLDEEVGDCIAEYLTVKQEYGAVAGIWNLRSGWWLPHGTDAPSQRYHREFWDAVFGEGICCMSQANQDSKEDLLYQV